jgi:hypothetical protein
LRCIKDTWAAGAYGEGMNRCPVAPSPRAARCLRLAAHAIAPILLATSIGFGSEDALTAQEQLRVTAVVAEKATVRLITTPHQLEIRPEDVQRGLVDVPATTVFTVRCNLRAGIGIQVELDPDVVTGATVTGLEHIEQLGGAGGVLRVGDGQHRQETRYELHWRLRLAPEVQAGVYPWPVQMQLEGL